MVNHWIVGSFSPWKPPTRQVNSWDVPDNETWSLGDRDNTLRNYRIITFILIQDNKIKPRVNSFIYQIIVLSHRDRVLWFFITWFHLDSTEQNAPTFVKNLNLNCCLQFMKTDLDDWWWWCYQSVKKLYCSYLSTQPSIKVIPMAGPASKVGILNRTDVKETCILFKLNNSR